jgi:lysophospholipase L1-like esterase
MKFRIAVAVVALLVPPLSLSPRAQGRDRWMGTWATAAVGRPQAPPMPGPGPPPFMANQCPAPAPVAPPPAGQTFAPLPFVQFTNQTLRQIVHVSIGGSKARVVVSNVYGTTPLTIGAGHIGLRETRGTIRTGSGGPLTFSGRPTVTIPANAIVYSDAVTMNVPSLSDLAVDLYLPGSTNVAAPLTMHTAAFQTSYVSETGNHVGSPSMPDVVTTQSWYLLSRVEVAAPDATGLVVAFGDSITDGTRSTPDTNSRWPDVFARRLYAQSPPLRLGVTNAGIAGNRVLNEGAFNAGINALARFDVDVLDQPGVTHVIVMEGINDIGNARQNSTPTAEDIIAAHRQLIERAHARGVAIIGATLTPFWGAAYYTDAGEAKRQALNEWIRNGKAYDGVIDFDKAARDPGDPKKLNPAFDSCDHLHPNDAGYRAMAESIDLSLFATPAERPSNGRTR